MSQRKKSAWMKENKVNQRMLRVVSTAIVGVLTILILCIRPRAATSCNMLDIGQGDCLVIKEKSGCNVMVDGGSSDVSSVGKYRIIPYLQSQGIDKLDYVFISHADSDHISGIMEMLTTEAEKVEISCLVLTKFAMVDGAYAELLEAAQKQGVRVLYVAAGDVFQIGETTWTCLYPDVDEVAEGNDQSMVLLMECQGLSESTSGNTSKSISKNTSILFTGDLTEAKEISVDWQDVNILKVGHHGSRFSTTEIFLDQCKPEVAIISAGKDNSYGHPHEETLGRLDKCKSQVFSTVDCGMISIQIETGEGINVHMYKE